MRTIGTLYVQRKIWNWKFENNNSKRRKCQFEKFLSALNNHKNLQIHYLTNRKDTNVINVIMMQCASAPSNKKSTTAANSFSTRRRKQTTKDGLPLFVASSTPRTTPAVFSDRHQPPMTFLLQLHDEVAVAFHSGKQHAGSRLLCCSWRKPLHSCHPALDVHKEVWVRPFVTLRFYT